MEMTTTMETIINNKDIELLKKILKMDTFDLYDFVEEEVSKYYSYIDTDRGARTFLYARGDLPVLVVAHLDTVFDVSFGNIYSDPYFGWGNYDAVEEEEEKRIYHDREAGILWSPDGLGGDDRVGVFMILSLIKRGLKPSILFTTDEEIGSQSGLKFAQKYKKIAPRLGYNYLLELDRAGEEDCVFYNCDNPEFTKYIESFGFKEAKGSFTDIVHLCPIFKTAGVNLSVGYYYEHTKAEMINLFTMSKNFDIIYIMLEESKKIEKPFEYIPKKVLPSSFPTKKKKTKTNETTYQCLLCDATISDYLFAPDAGQICLDCFEKYYQ